MSISSVLIVGVFGFVVNFIVLGVIFDNIVNVNMVGYKKMNVNFFMLVICILGISGYFVGGVFF